MHKQVIYLDENVPVDDTIRDACQVVSDDLPVVNRLDQAAPSTLTSSTLGTPNFGPSTIDPSFGRGNVVNTTQKQRRAGP